MRWQDLFTSKFFRFWLMTFGLMISLLCFEEVVDDVFFDPLEGDVESQKFDRAIGLWANRVRSSGLTQVMIDFTALGSISVLSILLIILISVLATFRDVKGIIYLSLVGLGASIWPLLLKNYFKRERPVEIEHLVHVLDFSFPSGHSFGAAAIYISLAYYSGQYARMWKQELFFYCLGGVLIAVVGISRIYLGVHFPTDVLAGLSGGVAWGLLVSALCEVHSLRNSRTIKRISE